MALGFLFHYYYSSCKVVKYFGRQLLLKIVLLIHIQGWIVMMLVG